MSRHLVEWLLKNPIELPEVENVGTDRAWRVLMGLADHADENTGAVWVSDRTQERETGLERRGAVQPVRKALEQAGWLVDTGKRGIKGVKKYELIVPGYDRPVVSGLADHATKTVEKTPSGVGSGVGSGLGSGLADHAQTEPNRTPPPNPPQGANSQHDQGEKEWGQEHDHLLANCLGREKDKTPNYGAGLVRNWHRDYRPIVTRALKERPTTDLVGWCYQVRNGEAPTPATTGKSTQGDKYDPTCTTCDKGLVIVRDKTYPGSFDTEWCACTERNALRLVNE
jgi:hypothetical protein